MISTIPFWAWILTGFFVGAIFTVLMLGVLKSGSDADDFTELLMIINNQTNKIESLEFALDVSEKSGISLLEDLKNMIEVAETDGKLISRLSNKVDELQARRVA